MRGSKTILIAYCFLVSHRDMNLKLRNDYCIYVSMTSAYQIFTFANHTSYNRLNLFVSMGVNQVNRLYEQHSVYNNIIKHACEAATKLASYGMNLCMARQP